MVTTAAPLAPPTPPLPVASFRDVARVLGVSLGAVAEWKRKGCPALAAPPYDASAIAAWRAEHVGPTVSPVVRELSRAARIAREAARRTQADSWAADAAALTQAVLDAAGVVAEAHERFTMTMTALALLLERAPKSGALTDPPAPPPSR